MRDRVSDVSGVCSCLLGPNNGRSQIRTPGRSICNQRSSSPTTMKFSLASFVALSLAVVSNAFMINTPANVVECQPILLSWDATGATAPFFLSVLPGGQPGAAALVNLGQVTGTSFTWNANLASGTNCGLTLRDSTGAVAQSGQFIIQPGTSSACLTASPSTAPPATAPPSTGTGSGSVSAPPATTPPTTSAPPATTPPATTPSPTPTTPAPTTKPTTSATSAAAASTSKSSAMRGAGVGAAGVIGALMAAIVA
ncbi:hypothetical protein BD410DRAFT_795231 [Rickenella mellea]|uniref:Uncharacterized protein n=1 Tax=Rickenella mellea TaxID=50990 RepID=A0A4Y7PQ04_9AGAM|nr:hypothetical protein BD410DRAFT_795231 [Rickenella mellea]